MKNIKTLMFISILGVFLYSCSGNEQTENTSKTAKIVNDTIQMIDFPSKAESSVSNLHVGKNGSTYLTWVEEKKNKSTLYFSTLDNTQWSNPTKIIEAKDFVVNWADFTSLIQFGENSLVVNVLKETNKELYAYDVQLLISNDNGKTWGEPFTPHSDGTETEHGFVSLVPYDANSFMAIWLDGRKYASENNPQEMTLRAAIIDKEGKIKEEFLIDERVCDCCGTNAINTGEGVVVVYRDRSEKEVRDISMVQFKEGKWSNPTPVSNDNWEIFGCPVNGPAIDALNGKLAVSWFTGANDAPKVNTIFSEGLNFGDDLKQINIGNTNGRVDVCLIDEENAVVSWMESENDQFFIKARTVKNNIKGVMGEPITIAKLDGSRSSGFPKVVKNGEDLIFTWTDTKKQKTIKTARLSISMFQ